MSIVFITIPGADKCDFANTLHEKTGEGIKLVVIQKPKKVNPINRLRSLRQVVGVTGLPKELYYAARLRFDRRRLEALNYFRAPDRPFKHRSFAPKTLEVDSVNSDEVYDQLKKIAPKVLVVWGSTILKPRLLSIAKHTINLHLGHCPHYRGALANQHAVLRGDYSRIGATIHHVNHRADAGHVLAVIAADHTKKPKEMFRELSDKAKEQYLDVAHRLWLGEDLPATKQDDLAGQTMLLKEWVPSRRYRVSQKILDWERRGISSY